MIADSALPQRDRSGRLTRLPSSSRFYTRGCRLDAVQADLSDLTIDASSNACSVVCPGRGHRSHRVHVLYTRSLADLLVHLPPMPFNQKVRIDALVAAARHCCVCHRYNGVGVEVHHIDPEAQSGDNSAANAIALCFDCHAAAGHYNPQHPKGTKYSSRELRAARDAWHQTVETRSLDVPEAEVLYGRYLLCKSVEVTREIASGALSDVPVPHPLLVSNAASALQRRLTEPYGQDGRPDDLYGDAFPSADAYFQAHPQARDLSDSDDYPYFSAVRPVTAQDGERVADQDSLTRMLLAAGVAAADLVSAYASYDECGGGGHQESYRLRPLWSVYLAATNLTDALLRIEAIVGQAETGDGLTPRPIPTDAGGPNRHPVPACRLPPGATLLLPVATLLGPLEYVETEDLGEVIYSTVYDQAQSVRREDLSAAAGAIAALGPAFWPTHIATGLVDQPVHRFDPTNLYTVTRYWEMGSCPHLFVQTGDGLRYVRELFVETPGLLNSEIYVVPAGGRALVLAELEDETTAVESVEVNGVHAVGPLTLVRGDRLDVNVHAGDVVRFTGHYVADRETRPQPWEKNRVVASFAQTHQLLRDAARP